MIDLHCHILPGIDDGAPTVKTSLEMARAFVADGVTSVACTPHILPGLYHNSGTDIRKAVAELQLAVDAAGIPLQLIPGADNHLTPTMVPDLRSGHLLSLGDSRYVLVEPPHHVVPPRMEETFFGLVAAGYVPILTHPERLTWIANHYGTVEKLVRSGALMQLTAGSLLGSFGKNPLYWAERMLDDGLAHILATDSHDMGRRPPCLGRARERAIKRVGEREAENLVSLRPRGILENVAASELNAIERRATDHNAHGGAAGDPVPRRSFARRLLRIFG